MTPQTLTGRPTVVTHSPTAGESLSPCDQSVIDTHTPTVAGGTTSHRAEVAPTPFRAAPGGAPSLAHDLSNNDTRGTPVVSETLSRPASRSSAPIEATPDGSNSLTDQSASVTRRGIVGEGLDRPAGAEPLPAPVDDAPRLDDPTLNAVAALVDDLEDARIAAEHRIRILTRPADEADEDGVFRGHGLPESEVVPLQVIAESLAKVEHQAVLQLQRAIRKHPMGPWVKATKGVGEKQTARLLAVVGDPYINASTGQPRTVSQLWAYCGLHVLPADQQRTDDHAALVGGAQSGGGGDPRHSMSVNHDNAVGVAARRRKGQKANWSTVAKTRAYLIALSCLKQSESPYRKVYDARRAHTAITHPEWTPGHSHNDGLRIASKAVLRDMWREARRIHTGT